MERAMEAKGKGHSRQKEGEEPESTATAGMDSCLFSHRRAESQGPGPGSHCIRRIPG